jgi:hypothetical protein
VTRKLFYALAAALLLPTSSQVPLDNCRAAQSSPADAAAEFKALWDACTAALADGKLDWLEIATIDMKLVALLGKLKLAGFKVA